MSLKMRITKEVTISATVNDTWLRLADAFSFKLDNKARGSGSSRRNQDDDNGLESIRVLAMDPPHKVSFIESADENPIITTFELGSRKKGTTLKVTVSGWDKVDSRMARVEMPKVSFTWEKRLSELKKTIEKGVKAEKSPTAHS
jgi:uncharacterized protein YndB with AHSA1/START domain